MALDYTARPPISSRMTHYLAEINIARFRTPKDDPANQAFMDAINGVNARAESATGFIWRLVDEAGGDATSIEVGNDPNLAVNMSMWESVTALFDFTFRDEGHVAIMRRRREWFDRMDAYVALWWVPIGHIPTVAEGMEKIAHLATHGPTIHAFSFKQAFDRPA